MTDFPGSMDWVTELIPDVAAKTEAFTVDTEEVDEELVTIFIEEIRRLTGELQQGLEQENSEAIRVAAHSIKGMGGTMGLPEISVVGLEIENFAKEEQLSAAAPLIQALAGWMASFS